MMKIIVSILKVTEFLLMKLQQSLFHSMLDVNCLGFTSYKRISGWLGGVEWHGVNGCAFRRYLDGCISCSAGLVFRSGWWGVRVDGTKKKNPRPPCTKGGLRVFFFGWGVPHTMSIIRMDVSLPDFFLSAFYCFSWFFARRTKYIDKFIREIMILGE